MPDDQEPRDEIAETGDEDETPPSDSGDPREEDLDDAGEVAPSMDLGEDDSNDDLIEDESSGYDADHADELAGTPMFATALDEGVEDDEGQDNAVDPNAQPVPDALNGDEAPEAAQAEDDEGAGDPDDDEDAPEPDIIVSPLERVDPLEAGGHVPDAPFTPLHFAAMPPGDDAPLDGMAALGSDAVPFDDDDEPPPVFLTARPRDPEADLGTPLDWGVPGDDLDDEEELEAPTLLHADFAPLEPTTDTELDEAVALDEPGTDDAEPAAAPDGPTALYPVDDMAEFDETQPPPDNESIGDEALDDTEALEETPADLQPLEPRLATAGTLVAPPLGPVPHTPHLPDELPHDLPGDLEEMVPLVPASPDAEGSGQTAAEPEEEEERLQRQGVPINALVVVMTAIGAAIIFGFLLIEPSPRWLLLAGAILVIFAMDGVLRGTWGEPFASEGDATPYLFLPALYILAAPMLVEHNIPGYWVLPAGLLVSFGFGVVVVGELISVRTGAPEYPIARLIETVASYFVLFALISLTYVFNLDLPMAMLAIGILTLMLAIEVLRQGEVDPIETLLLAIVTALVLVQARWLLHYLPVDGYLAGLTLTLVFFLSTGLLHAYVERNFDRALVLEYATIAAAGVALVTAARVTGLA